MAWLQNLFGNNKRSEQNFNADESTFTYLENITRDDWHKFKSLIDAGAEEVSRKNSIFWHIKIYDSCYITSREVGHILAVKNMLNERRHNPEIIIYIPDKFRVIFNLARAETSFEFMNFDTNERDEDKKRLAAIGKSAA